MNAPEGKAVSAMSRRKWTHLGLMILAAGINAVFIAGCADRSPKRPSAEETAAADTPRETSGKAPPIPVAGPLAKPRSLQQVGLPVELTRAEIPPDNPQTP